MGFYLVGIIVLAFYSDNPSSNPPKAYICFCKKGNQERGRGIPFNKNFIGQLTWVERFQKSLKSALNVRATAYGRLGKGKLD